MIKKKILTANWCPFEGSFLSVEQPMRTQESLCSVVISQERLLKIEDFILNQNDPASRTLLKGNLKATQEVLFTSVYAFSIFEIRSMGYNNPEHVRTISRKSSGELS